MSSSVGIGERFFLKTSSEEKIWRADTYFPRHFIIKMVKPKVNFCEEYVDSGELKK